MASMLLCALATASAAQSVDEELNQRILEQARKYHSEQRARADAIDARMAKLDFASALRPDQLARVDGRRVARAELSELQSILVDRRANVRIDLAEGERQVNNLPAGQLRDAAMQTFLRNKATFEPAFRSMDAAQENEASAITSLLDWLDAQARAGQVPPVLNGQWSPGSEKQRAQLRALLTALSKSDEEASAALAAMRSYGERPQLKEAERAIGQAPR